MKTQLILEKMPAPSDDMIVIKELTGVACGMVHIDTFWNKLFDEKDGVYEYLRHGSKPVRVTLTMEEDE